MTMQDKVERQRGHGTAVSPLVCDLLAQDSHPLPVALQPASNGNTDPASRRVAFSRYFSPEFQAQEKEHLWRKVWQFACREEDLPNIGDRVNYDVGDDSYIIMRSGEDEFRAFNNACLHRGNRLCHGLTSGESLRCSFHAWEWNVDGTVRNIPSKWDFPQVKKEEYRLPEIRIDRWGGFLFVNPDPDAGPLSESLGVLPAHFASWKPEDRFTFVHVRKLVRANWKTTMEAFLEAYHVIETHPDAMPFTGDASTQYDIWDDGKKAHVSRSLTPLAVPSPHLGDEASVQAALDAVMQVFALSMGPGANVPTFDAAKGTGRADIAAWRREMMAAGFARDFSHLCDSELLDTTQYFMFPNFCPWYGEGLPLTYQFLPYKNDPDCSIMSIRLLLPVPGNGIPRPPSAPIIEVDFDETFVGVPELGLIGHIFEQDMSNLPGVQIGMKSAAQRFSNATLGQYQESRISHFHETLDRYLGQ